MRHIQPELVAFLDNKLKDNGLFHDAVEKKDFRLIMCLAAAACVGIKEKTGHNDGKLIVLIQSTVGGASGEPYCAAGMMCLIAYAELKTGLKSPVPATELAQDIWNKTPHQYRVNNIPLPGALGVWADLRNGKQLSTGHVEIVLAADGEITHNVGFNTSGSTDPSGTVNRDGNGVYYTVRDRHATSSRKFLGFVKPI